MIARARVSCTFVDMLAGDLIGRRLAFNLTLFICGLFGLVAGAAPSFVSCAVLVALCGFGVGGNCTFSYVAANFS